MSWIRSHRAFSAAFVTLFLSILVVSCGNKPAANTNPAAGPVPAQVASIPASSGCSLPLDGTWETSCINNTKYTMIFVSGQNTMMWISTNYVPADMGGGSSCEQISGNPTPLQYEFDCGTVGALSAPQGGTQFNFYSPDGSDWEQNVMVYNTQNQSIGLGDWTLANPTSVAYTFSKISN